MCYTKTWKQEVNTIQRQDCDILADNGAATCATAIAASRWIKNNNPTSHLIIAIPVAPKETLNLFKREADHVEVIISPSNYNFKSWHNTSRVLNMLQMNKLSILWQGIEIFFTAVVVV